MNINIANSIDQQYLIPFGISHDEVRDAVFNEDFKKIIPLDENRKLIMFMKKGGSSYLLVNGRWSAPNLLIYSVFRILSKTAEQTDVTNPLAVLEKLAKECGYELQIGNEKDKFIHDTSIKVPKILSEEQYGEIMSRLIKIPEWDRGSNDVALQDSLMRLRRGENNDFVDVALAYCISSERYRKYLKER